MKREKFNGVELFATEEEWHTMQGMTKSHLKVNGADYVNDGSDAVTGQNAISLGTKQPTNISTIPISPSVQLGNTISMSSNFTLTQLSRGRWKHQIKYSKPAVHAGN